MIEPLKAGGLTEMQPLLLYFLGNTNN